MASLPTELLTEILSRLSVKSLTRFLCVNKSWFSLIKSPRFVKLHLNKTLISNSEGYLIIADSPIYIAKINLEDVRSPISFSELQHPLKLDEVKVIGSCNGILCISDFRLDNVFLHNPLTKSHRKLPVKHAMNYTRWWDYPVVYGLGYDSVTDDYKVCCLFRKLNCEKMNLIEAEVLSFKNNSWKSIEGIREFDSKLNSHGIRNYESMADGHSIYLNEAIYFFDCDKGPAIDSRHKFITKFDCRTDTLLRVECPNYDEFDANTLLRLSVFDGCLCMSVSYFPKGWFADHNKLIQVDLWMMKRCGENEAWMKFFSIGNPKGIGIHWEISIVTFSKDRSKILFAVDGCKFGWYDLNSGLFERIIPCGQPKFWVLKLCYISGSLVLS